MIDDRSDLIFEALKKDLGKCHIESGITETLSAAGEIEYALKNMKKWARPRRVYTPIANQPGSSRIISEPLGVSLIIAPWNYPFLLLIAPLAAAIAAGCCAILKPSELTPNVSAVIKDGISEYLDKDAFAVVEGDGSVASELLEQRFDHIFYTGGQRIGKIVMTAAAKHLTPVTLELGGKSPCFVDRTADLKVAARRIVWGKFLNAGQTCVAPDYLLVHQDVEAELLTLMRQQITRFYGEDPRASNDYGRIVSDSHFQRLTGLLADGEIVVGGQSVAEERYLAPTILQNVSPESELMQSEIFGPLLPVLTVKDSSEAIEFINSRPRPLAAYLFSTDSAVQQSFVDQTSSGGICINDVVMHLSIPGLPFGGVGASGMGSYHGRAGFETFSHAKAVLKKSNWFELPLRYPPYSDWKFKWIRRFM
jgi:aldehyde dehydrogenase (NAD+)